MKHITMHHKTYSKLLAAFIILLLPAVLFAQAQND